MGPTSFREARISIGGNDLRVRTAGPMRASGRPAALLVHGLGVSSEYMVPLARELARTRPVVLPDLPGHGGSSRPRGVPDERDHAATLIALLDQLHVPGGPLVLVANSWGCQIAVEACLARPLLFARAVLLGPTVDRHHRGMPQHVARLLALGVLESPRLNALQVCDYLRTGPIRALREFRHAQRHDMLAAARRVRKPVLVARGAHDPICSAAWVADLVEALPDGRAASFQAAGHVLNWWPAGEVAAAIDAFSGTRE